MDITWVTDRIAVGGGIWNQQNMAELVRQGVTHIINMQIEFDDRQLADGFSIEILHNPTDDDFQPKPPELFRSAVDFALRAINDATANNRVFIHCAAGVHRAPMMTLALLRVKGWSLEKAKGLILTRRYVVDFADVYVESVEEFVKDYQGIPAADSTPM